MTDLTRWCEFEKKALEIKSRGESFVVATIISVRGSTSAKPGHKAVISAQGENLWGWVGGGCAERFICQQSLEVLSEGQPRVVHADLEDEIFGLGMPCGGHMEVYLEPQIPPKTLHVSVTERDGVSQSLSWLAGRMNFHLEFSTDQMPAISLEKGLWILAQEIARSRDQEFRALTLSKVSLLDLKQSTQGPLENEILIFGNSRIGEELATLSQLLGWKITVFGPRLRRESYATSVDLRDSGDVFTEPDFPKNGAVVIAAHHKGDPQWAEKALNKQVPYVGIVASPHRSKMIFDEISENFQNRLRAPAGLQMYCKGPSEVALSIMAEILEFQNPNFRSLSQGTPT